MKKITIALTLAAAFGLNGTLNAQHVWKSVSAGDATTYAIRDDGTLWTCGWNEKGQLGVPEIKERTATFQCVGSDKDWKMAAGAKAYAFFIKENGTLWAVGTQESGVQGTGDGMDHKTVVQIGTDNDWTYVTGCRFWGYSAFALKADGTLWGWGNNLSYQLGLGNNQNQMTPVQIGTDNDWTSVTAGEDHVVALKKDGTMWGWGSNVAGGLGIKNEGSSRYTTPTQIGTDTDWIYVQAIGQRTYAIKKDGTLWGTGFNYRNLLGLNQPEDQLESIVYQFKQITAITEKVISVSGCESTTTVATGENGVINHIYVWGENADGALGDNNGKIYGSADIPFSATPVTPLLPEGLTYKQLTSGQSYSIVLTSDGEAYGWGRNKGGQLGDDTDYEQLQTSYYKKPIRINCPQDEISSIYDVEKVNAAYFDGTTLYALNGAIEQVKIYTVTGMLVNNNERVEGNWNLSELNSGIYLLSFVQNGTTYTQKIVKK